MMEKTLVFIHGLESTSLGNKAQFFRKSYPHMIIEDYTGNFEARMSRLRLLLQEKNNLILVGSSYGGLMAASFALEDESRTYKLVLLAPALTIEGFESSVRRKLQTNTILYHGLHDDVVNPHETKRIAEKTFARLEHHFVEDDHPLSRRFTSFPWNALLEQA